MKLLPPLTPVSQIAKQPCDSPLSNNLEPFPASGRNSNVQTMLAKLLEKGGKRPHLVFTRYKSGGPTSDKSNFKAKSLNKAAFSRVVLLHLKVGSPDLYNLKLLRPSLCALTELYFFYCLINSRQHRRRYKL